MILDEEIYSLMKPDLKEMFKYFPPGFVERYQPEIDGILRSLIFWLTIGLNKVLLFLYFINFVLGDDGVWRIDEM